MKRFSIFIAFALFLFTSFNVSAQKGVVRLDASYAVGIPMGNFKDIVDVTSGRGWNAAVLYGVSDKFSVGFQTGMQDFYQKYPRAIYHQSGNDLSAVVTNSIKSFPLMAKGKYKFNEEGVVQPFVALAAGASLVQYRKYYGEFAEENSSFSFAAQPEVGLYLPFGKGKTTGFHLSAGYNLIPYKKLDADGLNNAVIKAGISFNLR